MERDVDVSRRQIGIGLGVVLVLLVGVFVVNGVTGMMAMPDGADTSITAMFAGSDASSVYSDFSVTVDSDDDWEKGSFTNTEVGGRGADAVLRLAATEGPVVWEDYVKDYPADTINGVEVVNGNIYTIDAGGSDNKPFVKMSTTGSIQWSSGVGCDNPGFAASSTASGDRIALPCHRDATSSSDGYLELRNGGGGKVWSREGYKYSIRDNIVFKQGSLYAATNDPNEADAMIRKYSLDNGDVQWSTSLPGNPSHTGVAAGDEIYGMGSNGKLYKVDADDGSLLWTESVPGSFDLNQVFRAASSSHVFVADASTLFKYDTAGRKEWEVDVPPYVRAIDVGVNNEYVFVTVDDQNVNGYNNGVHIYDYQDGDRLAHVGDEHGNTYIGVGANGQYVYTVSDGEGGYYGEDDHIRKIRVEAFEDSGQYRSETFRPDPDLSNYVATLWQKAEVTATMNGDVSASIDVYVDGNREASCNVNAGGDSCEIAAYGDSSSFRFDVTGGISTPKIDTVTLHGTYKCAPLPDHGTLQETCEQVCTAPPHCYGYFCGEVCGTR